MSTTTELSVRRTGAWRHEVLDRVGRLEHELLHFSSADEPVKAVHRDLDAARGIANDPHWTLDGWSGRSTENAWRHLRLAEEGLVDLVREGRSHVDELTVTMKRALGHGKDHLPADDPMLKDLQAIDAKASKSLDDWARVKELSSAITVRSHEVSTRRHHQQRSFRNQLRGLTLVLLGLAGASVAALAVMGTDAPTDLLAAPVTLDPWVAVVMAMGLGSIGALFSAIPSLSAKPSEATAFNTLKEQAALKVVVGAWSAVVGLVIVNAGMAGLGAEGGAAAAVGGVEDAATMAGFAVMAAYFGATQEALTRFADRKASAVDPSTP